MIIDIMVYIWQDAIRYENGREVAGSAIIVEWAKGAPRRSGRDRDSRDMRDSGRSRVTIYTLYCNSKTKPDVLSHTIRPIRN
jgi:hypothetical protein